MVNRKWPHLGNLKDLKEEVLSLLILSTEGRGVRLCWAHSKPKEPQGKRSESERFQEPRRFRGVPRCFEAAPKFGENAFKTELKDGSQMWFRNFEVRLGTSRTLRLALRNRGFGGQS